MTSTPQRRPFTCAPTSGWPHQPLQDQGSLNSRRSARSHGEGHGRRARLAYFFTGRLTGASWQKEAFRSGSLFPSATMDLHPRSSRSPQPSQIADRRQSRCVDRRSKLADPRVPHQAALRAVGRCDDPLGGPSRGHGIASTFSDGRWRPRHQRPLVRTVATEGQSQWRDSPGHRHPARGFPLRRHALPCLPS